MVGKLYCKAPTVKKKKNVENTLVNTNNIYAMILDIANKINLVNRRSNVAKPYPRGSKFEDRNFSKF